MKKIEKRSDAKKGSGLEGELADCQKSLAELEKTESLYRRIVENASEGILVAREGRILFCNPKVRQMLGIYGSDLSFAEIIHPDDREMVLCRHHMRMAGNSEMIPSLYPFRVVKGGEILWVEINSVMIQWEGMPATLNFVTDITERKRAEEELASYRGQLEELVAERTSQLTRANGLLQNEIQERWRAEAALRRSEEKYKNILKSIEEGYFEVDLGGHMIFFNDAMCEISGCTSKELMGMHNREYTSPETARRMYEVFNRVYQTGRSVKIMDFEIIRKDDTPRILEMSIALIRDEGEKPEGFRGIVRDVTERNQAQARLAYLAYHDSLTGLLNRKAFLERLEESITYAGRYGMKRAILFIDLDRFKQVNDTYGHEIGDKLLEEVARRLEGTIRSTDIICRLGGDEFTVILNNPDNPRPQIAADKIRTVLSEPYVIDNITIDYISTSIGISIFPDHGEEVRTLIRNADIAMYSAKDGRDCCICYDEGMVRSY